MGLLIPGSWVRAPRWAHEYFRGLPLLGAPRRGTATPTAPRGAHPVLVGQLRPGHPATSAASLRKVLLLTSWVQGREPINYERWAARPDGESWRARAATSREGFHESTMLSWAGEVLVTRTAAGRDAGARADGRLSASRGLAAQRAQHGCPAGARGCPTPCCCDRASSSGCSFGHLGTWWAGEGGQGGAGS